MMIYTTTAVTLLAGLGAAQKFSIATHDDIVASAKTLASDLMTLYSGNQTGETPGLLPGPPPSGDYYWWEGAGFLATFIDYWHVTGDETYNDVVTQGLLFQRGPNDNYMPPNVTAQLGNDDQCAWALASMIAAENNFPELPKGQASWVAVAENAFNTLVVRYDDGTCGGGLRWQVPLSNNGYNYKNSEFFLLTTSPPEFGTVLIETSSGSHVQRVLLQSRRPPRAIHGQRNIRTTGCADVGLAYLGWLHRQHNLCSLRRRTS